MATQKNSSKEQSKSTTGEKNSQESAQKKNLSKPKASTYLTFKESVSSLNKHNIKATFYTQTTLRSLLSKPKDPIPKEDRNNAVYQLNCKHCEAVYVGETKRTLNIRAEQHITTIKSASKRSHTAEHCWKYNHDFHWEHKKVLDVEKNWKTRTIKEAQKKTSIISMEYPSNYQIFANQYFKKAKQRKQLPKLQHSQTESTKVRQQVWFHTSPKPKSANQK